MKAVEKSHWTVGRLAKWVALSDSGGDWNGVVTLATIADVADAHEGDTVQAGVARAAGGVGGTSVSPVVITEVAMTTTCAAEREDSLPQSV